MRREKGWGTNHADERRARVDVTDGILTGQTALKEFVSVVSIHRQRGLGHTLIVMAGWVVGKLSRAGMALLSRSEVAGELMVPAR
jgi:hypothetical protein